MAGRRAKIESLCFMVDISYRVRPRTQVNCVLGLGCVDNLRGAQVFSLCRGVVSAANSSSRELPCRCVPVCIDWDWVCLTLCSRKILHLG